MQRQREVAVDDEEELLRMQEQFQAQVAQRDGRPAAKFTRVTRRPAASPPPPPPPPLKPVEDEPHECAEHEPECEGHHGDRKEVESLISAMQTAMKNIVGDVKERTADAAAPQPPSSAAATAASSFPQATHRKLSKFALGRQRQRETAPAEGSASVPPPPPLPASGAAPLMDEGGQIDAENRQLLAAMTPEQVAEAREEAVQRLPPAAIDFLRRRAASRAAAAATSPSPAAPHTAAPHAPLEAAQPGGAVGGMKGPGSSSKHPLQAAHQQQAPVRQAAASRPSPPNASAASRLRFDLEGCVVGLREAGAAAEVSPADVAQRDILRQDEAGGPQGYSLEEACLLCRSSLPQQRVLALRLLAAVLALSRPSPAAPASAPLPLPPAVAAELQLPAGLQRVAVWHHALHAADAALLLRRSLDDQHPAVAAAAAAALAALLGASGPAAAAEEQAAEAADAGPLTGWPAPPLRHMQRPTASGAWVVAPVSADEAGGQGGDGGGAEGEEALDEAQLSKVDPLTGLLHMGLLQRVSYLLGAGRVAAALDPLLVCQAGKDAADQVLAAPGMVAALKAVMDAPPPPPPLTQPPAAARAGAASASGAREGGGAGFDSATLAACHAARPKALRLLRQLAAASKAAARQLQEAGLVRFALEHLLRPAPAAVAVAGQPSSGGGDAGSRGSCGSSLRQRGQVAEALRLWRCFAQHSFYLLLLDDAYPALCTSFAPPLPAAAADAAAAGRALVLAEEQVQQWCVAREAYSTAAQLCWHAARSGPHDSQLSPQCAAALAAGALSWLAGLPLQGLVAACNWHTSSSTSLAAAATVAAGSSLSPFPALAASGGSSQQAAALLGTLASALHFVSSYWSNQAWHTAAEKAAAAKRLARLGVLPAAAGGEVPGVLRAVSGALEQLLAADAAGPWQAAAGTAGSAAGASAPAAALAELAVSLARLAATFLSPHAAATSNAALLGPLCGQLAAGRFLAAVAATDTTLSQPWDAARLLHVLPVARAAMVGLQAIAGAGAGAAADRQLWSAAASDTALALLQLLPAGDEAGALQLMALLLGPHQLQGPAAAACSCVLALAASPAAQLAAGSGGGSAGSPPTLPAAQVLSPLLLAGYAVVWLAMVSQHVGGDEGPEEDASVGAEPPSSSAILRPQGSRLPLPADWMLGELPLPPPEAGVVAEPGFAAACALLLALGLEEQQLGSLSAAGLASEAALVQSKLRRAVMLVYGDREQAAAAPAAAAQREQDEVWDQPLARWCLAALMQRYCSADTTAASGLAAGSGGSADASTGGGTQAGGWQQQEARQLAQHFAAASYGDRLFGAAVALLLRCCVPVDTQLEVLSVLADEQALHLLPPLALLPGPPTAYLPPLPGALATGGGGAGTFGQACFGASSMPGAVGGGGGGGRGRQELDLYVKLLTEGPLERCLAAAGAADCPGGKGGREEGGGGCLEAASVAVPLVLHRLAAACFPPEPPLPGGDAPATSGIQQQALLCSLLQRCCGEHSSSSGAVAETPLLVLLRLLLCWDLAAAGPSAVLPSNRRSSIETACATTGIDADAVLRGAGMA
ncbi:Transcriptional elongation regulator MINIYO [Chlorella vulgaris]